MSTLFISLALVCTMMVSASAQWAQIPLSDQYIGVAMYLNDNVAVVATIGDGIVILDRSGVSRKSNSGLPADFIPSQIRFTSNGLFVVTDAGLFRSMDTGRSWSKFSTNQPDTTRIYDIVESASSLYVATSEGLRRTTDAGATWAQVCPPDLGRLPGTQLGTIGPRVYFDFIDDAGGSDIMRILSPASSCEPAALGYDSLTRVRRFFLDDSVALIGSSRAIHRSITHKQITPSPQWQKTITPASDDLNVNAFLRADSLLFAGTGRGLLRSADNGATWQFKNYGLPADARVVAAGLRSSLVFICTERHGVWVRPLAQLHPMHVSLSETDTMVCNGDLVQLKGTVSGGIPPHTSTWRNVLTGDTELTFRADSDAVFSVTVRDSQDEVQSDTVRIHVGRLADAGPGRSIRWGDTVTIGTPGVPGYSYRWSPAHGIDDTTAVQPRVSPDSNTKYVLTLTGPGPKFCRSVDAVTVSVCGGPGAWVLRPSDTFLIAVPNGPGYRYRWYKNTDPILNADSSTLGIAGNGIYRVMITDSTGRLRNSDIYSGQGDDNDLLQVHDVYFPYGVVGEDKRQQIFLKNSGNCTLLLKGATLMPFDENSCNEDVSVFKITSEVAGLLIPPSDSVMIFMGFVPKRVGPAIARILFDYSMICNEQTQNPPAKRVAISGQGLAKGDYVTIYPIVDSIAPVANGEYVDVKIRMPAPIGELSPRPGQKFKLWLTFPSRLLSFTGSISFDTGCGTYHGDNCFGLCVQPGGTDATLSLCGTYRPCAGFITIPFRTILRDTSIGYVEIQKLEWVWLNDFAITIESPGPPVPFSPSDICRESRKGKSRLIRIDTNNTRARGLKLTHNSAERTLRIDFYQTAADGCDIAIHDVFGHVVARSRIESFVGDNTSILDVSNVPSGSYFVVLTTGEYVRSARFEVHR